MPAPVALFAYNRPAHLKQTLENLKNNYLSGSTDLFIYIDGPAKADETLKKKIEAVKNIAREKQWCKTVTIIESEKNKGLKASVITGVTEIVNKYGRIIVMEDDLVSSRWFLTFMNDALDKYENAEEVACISGYIYPIAGQLPPTFFIRGADCWGWATWKRAWNIFEPDGKRLLAELREKKLTGIFDFNKTHSYTAMLNDQVEGLNQSWAILWYASAFLKNRYCLYPGVSLVNNIGLDGSGIHSGVMSGMGTKVSSSRVMVNDIPVAEDKDARNKIAAYFKSLKRYSNPSHGLSGAVKKLIPYRIRKKLQVLRKPKIKPRHGWSGDYSSWMEAKQHCSGYGSEIILEKVKQSILKVKYGEAEYERDSVVFSQYEYSEPLKNALQASAAGGKLNVLDFGGSLGSLYFQYKRLLVNLKELRWNVVEQKHFVQCGKELLEDEQLKFFYTIEEVLNEGKPDLLILSSVLAYLEDPYRWMEKFIAYGFEFIIVDRTAFIDEERERITIQVVPEDIYKASYPAWFFNEQKFLNTFAGKYTLMAELPGRFDPEHLLDGKRCYRKGFYFRKK